MNSRSPQIFISILFIITYTRRTNETEYQSAKNRKNYNSSLNSPRITASRRENENTECCNLLAHPNFHRKALRSTNFVAEYYSPNIDSQATPRNASSIFSGYIPMNKIQLKSCHASGPGGQNVNSRNSKVELRFQPATADWIPKDMRERLLEKKKSQLTKNGELILRSDKTRSYHMNVVDVLQRLRAIIFSCQRHVRKPDRRREATIRRRMAKAKAKRLNTKHHRSLIKKYRTQFDHS